MSALIMAVLGLLALIAAFVLIFYVIPVAIGLLVAALPYILVLMFVLWLIR